MATLRFVLNVKIDGHPLTPWDTSKTVTESRIVDILDASGDVQGNVVFSVTTGAFALIFDGRATVASGGEDQSHGITLDQNGLMLCTNTNSMSYSVLQGTRVRGII